MWFRLLVLVFEWGARLLRWPLLQVIPREFTRQEFQLIVSDLIVGAITGANGGLPFWQVLRRRKQEKLVAVSVYGSATKVSESADRFLDQLMRRFAQLGWSVVNGGGPGIMERSFQCLQHWREEFAQIRSKCIAVKSAIRDERYNGLGDPLYTVRNQPRTEIREAMLSQLGDVADVVFIGSFGTIYELFDGIFRNYVFGRSDDARKLRPIILIDEDVELDGQMLPFYKSWFGLLVRLMKAHGVAKNVRPGVYLLRADDPDAVAHVERIVNHFRETDDYAGEEQGFVQSEIEVRIPARRAA